MTEKKAKRIVLAMMCFCVIMTVYYTFVSQDMIQALVLISSFFVFQFAWKNPKMLIAKSYKEFGDVVDRLDGVSEITGGPAYYISVICCVLFIQLF
jgi:hypothetical protein